MVQDDAWSWVPVNILAFAGSVALLFALVRARYRSDASESSFRAELVAQVARLSAENVRLSTDLEHARRDVRELEAEVARLRHYLSGGEK